MAAKKRQRDRRKPGHKEDPQVFVSPSHVRALLDELGMTVADLARKTGESEQTLAYLKVGEQPKRTRQSRRDNIARALGVVADDLARERALPSGTRIGYEEGYSVRTRLATRRLLTKVDQAVERDVNRDPRPPDAYWEADLARETTQDLMLELLRIGSWRERLLRWDPARHPRQKYREPLSEDPDDLFGGAPVEDEAHERAVLAFVRAWEHVLTPWFEGKARLDYATLNELTVGRAPVHTPDRERPAAVIKDIVVDPNAEPQT